MDSISRFMTVLFTSAAVMVMPALAFAETPPSAESDGPLRLNGQTLCKGKDQLGLGFPTNYQDEECVPVGKSDPCLPTGFVQAIEQVSPISRFGRPSFSSSKARRSVPTNCFSRLRRNTQTAQGAMADREKCLLR